MFLFRDVNHDSTTTTCVFMDEVFVVRVSVPAPHLSVSMPSGLLGRRERGEMPLLRSVLMS